MQGLSGRDNKLCNSNLVMKEFTLFWWCMWGLIWIIPGIGNAQDYCNELFTDNAFESIQKIELQYGRATDPTGLKDSVDLFLDLYYSTENTHEVQPMMILLHGGSFISELGDKSGMEEISRLMVSKGFVVASVGYRTWPYSLAGLPYDTDILDVVVKAMLDLQTAIEFVVRENGKAGFPRIDVQNLIIGGGSAGAIIALHRLYIDKDDVLPDFLAQAFEENGGLFETESDEYGIAYGLNMSGGIYDTAWIETGEPPLISIHGDQDSIVFYDYGLANGFINLYGSKPIDERLVEQGIASYLYTFEGGEHENIYDDNPMYRDRLLVVLDTGLTLIQELLCPMTSNRLAPLTADVRLINTLVRRDLIIHNREPQPMAYEIVDMWGRNIQSGVLQYGDQLIHFDHPVSGYFAFRTTRDDGQAHYQQLFYFNKSF